MNISIVVILGIFFGIVIAGNIIIIEKEYTPDRWYISSYLNRQCSNTHYENKSGHIFLMEQVEKTLPVKDISFLGSKHLKSGTTICVILDIPKGENPLYEEQANVVCSSYQQRYELMLATASEQEYAQSLPTTTENKLAVIIQFMKKNGTIELYTSKKCIG